MRDRLLTRIVCSPALGLLLLAIAGCAGSGGAVDAPEAATNLTVLSRLANAVADSAVRGISAGDQVLLRVDPPGSWFVFDAFERAIRASGGTAVASGEQAPARVEVQVLEASTRYQHAGRSWFLGPAEVQRTVAVTLRIRSESAEPPRAVVTANSSREYRDTVAAAETVSLETEGVPATRAPLPEGGWLEDFAEPILLAGAVAVAVLLLFTVRS